MIQNYLKIAVRNLWQYRGVSFLNLSGLSIGITTSFLILLYVNFELSYDQFHENKDRIYAVSTDIKTPSDLLEWDSSAWAIAPHIEQEFPEIELAVRVASERMIITNDTAKNIERVLVVDTDFFNVFSFELLQGNRATVLKAPFTAVLSEKAAKKYFGNENPIGKTLKFTNHKYLVTVTGVMQNIPKNSQITTDVFLSMSTYTESLDKDRNNNWGSYEARTYIMVHPKTNVNELTSKFPAFLERMNGKQMEDMQMYPKLLLQPFKESYLYDVRGKGNEKITNVYVFLMIGFFIVLIAATNAISLTTAQSVKRAKEIGVRKILGAKKERLVLQFLGEAIITSCIAFMISLLLIQLILPAFNTMAEKEIAVNVFGNFNHLALLGLLSLIIGVLSGIYPAFVLSSFKAVETLKGVFATGTKGLLLRKVLVVVQFTISIALIAGTLVISKQTYYMSHKDLGFNKESQLILSLDHLKLSKKALKKDLDQLPNVVSTSFSLVAPGEGAPTAYSKVENSQGEMQAANLKLYNVDYEFIPQYECKLLAGRTFSKDYVTDAKSAIIINETALRLFGYEKPEDALGARYEQWGDKGKIIGVVKDFHIASLAKEIRPLNFRIRLNTRRILSIKIRKKNIEGTLNEIHTVWKKHISDNGFQFQFLEDSFNENYQEEKRFSSLFFRFSILAIFISSLGLFGLSAYTIAQRKKEIGVRKVNGASVLSILRLLTIDFIKLVLLSIAIATPLIAYIMNRWLDYFTYRTHMNWWIFVIAGGIALLVAFMTVCFRAAKAAVTNPIKSLKSE